MAYNSYSAGRTENGVSDATGINTAEYYDRNLLENARENFLVSNFTSKKSMPKFEGKGVVFSYYDHIPAFVTPLVEGAAQGAGASLDKINIRTSMEAYGEFVPYTDDLDIYGEDGARFKKDVTTNLGGAAGEAQETLLINGMIASNTAIVFNTDVATTLMDAEVSIRKAKGKKFKSMLTGSTNYATSTIREAYVGVCSIDGARILRAAPGFVSVDKYGYSDGLLPNEIGSLEGVRYMETTLLPQNTAKERAIIWAEESIAEVGIRGMKKIQTIIKDLGSAGTADALNRSGSVGSKFRMAAVTLRPDWVCDVALQA